MDTLDFYHPFLTVIGFGKSSRRYPRLKKFLRSASTGVSKFRILVQHVLFAFNDLRDEKLVVVTAAVL